MKVATREDLGLNLGATFNGDAMGIQFVNGYSICATWTDGGSLEGTLKLQASNNPFTDNVNMTPNPDAVWADITGSTVNVTDAGTQWWNVADANYWAYRIVWTRTAGTGTMRVYHLTKGVQ